MLSKFIIAVLLGFAFNFGIFLFSWFNQYTGVYQVFMVLHDIKIPPSHYFLTPTSSKDSMRTAQGSYFEDKDFEIQERVFIRGKEVSRQVAPFFGTSTPLKNVRNSW